MMAAMMAGLTVDQMAGLTVDMTDSWITMANDLADLTGPSSKMAVMMVDPTVDPTVDLMADRTAGLMVHQMVHLTAAMMADQMVHQKELVKAGLLHAFLLHTCNTLAVHLSHLDKESFAP